MRDYTDYVSNKPTGGRCQYKASVNYGGIPEEAADREKLRNTLDTDVQVERRSTKSLSFSTLRAR